MSDKSNRGRSQSTNAGGNEIHGEKMKGVEICMKLLHLADLHIGKNVNRFSMLEDQKYILNQVLEIIDEYKPDVVMIAGDIYDKTIPSAEATVVFDDFLFALSQKGCKIFIISGNHDSAERVAFASRFLKHNNVFVSPVYNGKVEPVSLEDDYGRVNFYMLPFVKPGIVRHCFETEEIENHTDAVRAAVKHMGVDYRERNILIAHQFILNSELAGSEERSIGGTEDVDVSAVEEFDYVALGHIHKPQPAGKKHVRYSGSLLKYSFDEADQTKSVTLIDLQIKGDLTVRQIPLNPRREMRVLTGSYEELMEGGHKDPKRDDYIKVVLTDDTTVPDAMKKLRILYPNIMMLSYDNARTRNTEKVKKNERVSAMQPIDIVSQLFFEQNGKNMSEKQRAVSEEVIKNIWG